LTDIFEHDVMQCLHVLGCY